LAEKTLEVVTAFLSNGRCHSEFRGDLSETQNSLRRVYEAFYKASIIFSHESLVYAATESFGAKINREIKDKKRPIESAASLNDQNTTVARASQKYGIQMETVQGEVTIKL